MRPLQISPDTAVKLAKELGVPIEHLMHMPQHILLQKLAQLAQSAPAPEEGGPSDGTAAGEPRPDAKE